MRRRPGYVVVLLALVACALPSRAAPAGGTWHAVLAAAEGQDHLSGFANGVVYAQYGVGVMRSTDFGLTWQQLTGPPNQTGFGGSVRFATPALGFAVVGTSNAATDPTLTVRCGRKADLTDYVELWQTANGGTAWTPACGPAMRKGHSWSESPNGLFAGRDGKSLLLAGDEGPISGCDNPAYHRARAYLSPDAGRTWRSFLFGPGTVMGWFGGSVRDGKHAAVLVHPLDACTDILEKQAVWVTHDGGRTFKKVYTCPNSICSTVEVVSASRILIGMADGRTLVSKDGGRTFFAGQLLRSWYYEEPIRSGKLDPRHFWIQRFSFANDLVGYASTRGSGTWRTTDGGLNWTQETSPECSYYPWGIGDAAAAGPDHGIVGGPRSINARVPSDGPQLGCGTPPGQLPGVPADAVAAELPGGVSVSVTGRMSVRL